MKASLRRYYEYVAAQPCLACGRPDVELHHIKGVRSFKTRQELAPRKDLAEYAVVPLCSECHRTGSESVHALNQEAFGNRRLSGSVSLLQWAYTFALAYLRENG